MCFAWGLFKGHLGQQGPALALVVARAPGGVAPLQVSARSGGGGRAAGWPGAALRRHPAVGGGRGRAGGGRIGWWWGGWWGWWWWWGVAMETCSFFLQKAKNTRNEGAEWSLSVHHTVRGSRKAGVWLFFLLPLWWVSGVAESCGPQKCPKLPVTKFFSSFFFFFFLGFCVFCWAECPEKRLFFFVYFSWSIGCNAQPRGIRVTGVRLAGLRLSTRCNPPTWERDSRRRPLPKPKNRRISCTLANGCVFPFWGPLKSCFWNLRLKNHRKSEKQDARAIKWHVHSNLS